MGHFCPEKKEKIGRNEDYLAPFLRHFSDNSDVAMSAFSHGKKWGPWKGKKMESYESEEAPFVCLFAFWDAMCFTAVWRAV